MTTTRGLGLATVVVVCSLILWAGRDTVIEVRVHNASSTGYDDVSVAGQSFGALAPGETSEYRSVSTRFRYAVVRLAAEARVVSGQTLSLGAKRFTYRIDVVDLSAGLLAIDVVRERGTR